MSLSHSAEISSYKYALRRQELVSLVNQLRAIGWVLKCRIIMQAGCLKGIFFDELGYIELRATLIYLELRLLENRVRVSDLFAYVETDLSGPP